jgi:hypothetical protein
MVTLNAAEYYKIKFVVACIVIPGGGGGGKQKDWI